MKIVDPFWCKHCKTEFLIRFSVALYGDALVICPTCGWKHPRQFEAGLAVSCEPPRGKKYTIIEAIKE